MNSTQVNNEKVLHLIDSRRCALGMTEYEMCKRAGIRQSSFCNIKSNRRRLHTELATSLASVLELSPVQLLEASGVLPERN